MTTTLPSPEETPQEETSPPKKRRWLRRIIYLLLLIGILLFLVNGIVTRKIIHHFLNKSLEEQGLTGSAKINGSIIEGFQVTNLHYTGNKGIQSLQIDSLKVDYKINQLLDYKVDLLHASNIRTTIDIAKFPKNENEEKSSEWKSTLKELKPLIMHPEIGLENLDITLLNDSQKILNWKLASIQHDSATDDIHFNQWIISDATDHTTPKQSATLTWKDDQIDFDQLNLLPELSLSQIHIDWKSDLKGKTKINYHEAVIALDINQDTTLKLEKGEIRSADLIKTTTPFGIDLTEFDTEASINKLELNTPTKNLLPASESTIQTPTQPIPQWNLNGSLGLTSARWETYQLENTNLTYSQKDQKYQVNIDGTAINTPVKINLNGSWDAPKSTNWWESTTAELNLQTTTNDQILALIPDINTLPEELKINNTAIKAKINTKLINNNLDDTTADIELNGISIKKSPIPALQLSAKYINEEIQFQILPKQSSTFAIKGTLKNEQHYTASLTAKTNTKESPWINALAETYESPITLTDQLNIQWTGSGNLITNNHQGNLKTTNLSLTQPELDPIKINLTGKYDWPKSLDLEALDITQEELFAEASILWDGKTVSIRKSQIKRHGELIGKITGTIPFTTDIQTSEAFFAQTEPWTIEVDTETLRLKRITEILALSQDIELDGTLLTKITLAGSPHTPEVNGFIDIKSKNDILGIGLDNLSLNAYLATENKLLNINGDLLEDHQQRIAVDLQFPFTPHQWLADDNLIETIQNNSQLRGTAKINKLPLGRFSNFIPELETLEGNLGATAQFKGTIAEPKYNIDFEADLPLISLTDANFNDITNIQIKGSIDETMILNTALEAKINGGKFTTTIQADLNNPNSPIFDLNLVTNHALIYRDETLVTRTNANLRLKGTIEDALITGNIGILESLFYKDIDLIPIGIPTGTIETIDLPSIDTRAKEQLPIPAPFDQWKLDLNVKTADPILIRGNIGTGHAEGSLKIKGTLAKPRLDGTISAKKTKAKLPFSFLAIDKGDIIFSPNNSLIPTLDIRGKSQIGIHNVRIHIYGSADDPKIALSSLPALPENEIMTLLATGTTNTGLENQDVATFKTLQLLLLELKQRNDRPGGNRLFGKILTGIDDLDLKVGEVDQLTGEKYASATFELHRRWFLSAQISDNQPSQTRGLLIFALRFR